MIMEKFKASKKAHGCELFFLTAHNVHYVKLPTGIAIKLL